MMRIFYGTTDILINPRGRHVRRFSGASPGRVHTDCLFRYDEPVSPHLAVLRQGGSNQVFYIAIPPLCLNKHTFHRFPMLPWSMRSKVVCRHMSRIRQAPVMSTLRQQGVISPGVDLPPDSSCISFQLCTARHYLAQLKSMLIDLCSCQRF